MFLNLDIEYYFKGIPMDFSPNKLKKGSGLYALQCLTALVDKAIELQNIIIKK